MRLPRPLPPQEPIRNTAVNLARRGVNVIFTYRSNQKEADSLIREVEAMGSKAAGFRLDAGDTHAIDGFVVDVRKTLYGWGQDRFDYLVNNAVVRSMRISTKPPKHKRERSFQRRVFPNAKAASAN
jgi:NAD(P)-dependent dehydrogenase (short-subunit alcohol dehydrogenase family)